MKEESARNSNDVRPQKRKFSSLLEAEENSFVDLLEASTYLFKEQDDIEVRDLSVLIAPPNIESSNQQARGPKRKIDARITDEAGLEEAGTRGSSSSDSKKQKTRDAPALSAPAPIERPKVSCASRRSRSPPRRKQTRTSDSAGKSASLPPHTKSKGKERAFEPSSAASSSSDRGRDSPIKRRSRSPARRASRCESSVERNRRSPLRQVSSVRRISKIPPWSMPGSSLLTRTHVAASSSSTRILASSSSSKVIASSSSSSKVIASSSSTRLPASSSTSEMIDSSSSSSNVVDSSSTSRVTASSFQAAGDRPPAALSAEEFERYRIFQIMSSRLAKKAKNRGASRIQTKAGVLDHFHALCSYMLSFYYADKIGRSSIHDSIVAWKSLFPFCENLLRSLDMCGMYELRPLVHRLMGLIRFYLFGRTKLQLPTQPLSSNDRAVKTYLEFAAASFREHKKAREYYRMTENHMSVRGISAAFPKTFEDVCVRGDLSHGIVLDGEAGTDIKPMIPFEPYSELNHSAIIARCLLKEYAEKNNVAFDPITKPEEFM